MRRWQAISAGLVAATLSGCAAMSTDAQFGTVFPEPVATTPSSSHGGGRSPATAPAMPDIDAQQLAGQVVAGVQAELSSQIEATVAAALRAEVQATGIGGNATGYNSEFGVGATLVVSLTLLLSLILSHWREMLRIKQNGSHDAAHPRGKLQT